MKRIILISIIALLLPTLLCAQNAAISKLIESYSSRTDVEYVKANKAIIWMIKAKSPKGSMDGVSGIEIVNFKDGSQSSSFKSFYAQANTIFAQNDIELIATEESKDGTMKMYMNPNKENLTEYMMFMLNDKGETLFMHLTGKNLPSPKNSK